MLRFKLFGFPITVHWMFWILVILMSTLFIDADGRAEIILLVVWTSVFFVSILVHELGHAFLIRRYGGHPSIMIHGFGGFATMQGYYDRKQKLIIAFAGPAAGLCLGLTALVLRNYTPLGMLAPAELKLALGLLVWVNIFWSLVNLLPIFPMDGGRIFEAIVGEHRHKLIGYTGMVTGIVCAVLAVFSKMFILPFLLGYLAYQNFQRAQGKRVQLF